MLLCDEHVEVTCPGAIYDACMASCPSAPRAVFQACLRGCAERCNTEENQASFFFFLPTRMRQHSFLQLLIGSKGHLLFLAGLPISMEKYCTDSGQVQHKDIGKCFESDALQASAKKRRATCGRTLSSTISGAVARVFSHPN